jgi:Alpha galactosidase C-terminal beta sandwich domain
MPDLQEDRVELLRRTIAPHRRTARPVDYFENDPPEIWQVTDEKGSPRRDVIALFNWSDEEKKFDVPLARFDLPKADKYVAFDFWKKESLPALKDRLETTLPKHGCLIIAIRPMSDQPFVISTSRHVSQGMIDLADEKWDDATRTLSGKSKVVGGDPYEIRISVPFLTKRRPSPDVSAEDQEADVKIVAKGGAEHLVITSPTDREVQWKLEF